MLGAAVMLEKLYFYKIWVARKRPWSILITQKGEVEIRCFDCNRRSPVQIFALFLIRWARVIHHTWLEHLKGVDGRMGKVFPFQKQTLGRGWTTCGVRSFILYLASEHTIQFTLQGKCETPGEWKAKLFSFKINLRLKLKTLLQLWATF